MQKDKNLKIAVIGGSFNPVTEGHLKMAECVLKALPDIYQVWLMPAYRHPFEKHKAYESSRVKMIRLIESSQIRYFGYEIDNKLSGETYITFSRLLSDHDYKDKYEFHMVIGSDCVIDFDRKWKNAELLSRIVKFIIVPRPGYSLKGYQGLLSHPPHVILKGVETYDISATRVRDKISRNESIKGLVPENVRKFIIQNKLFTDN